MKLLLIQKLFLKLLRVLKYSMNKEYSNLLGSLKMYFLKILESLVSALIYLRICKLNFGNIKYYDFELKTN